MLYFNGIDFSEGTYVNKTSALKEFVTVGIFKGFKFQPDFCNGCHHLSMMSINLRDIAILNMKSANYHCVISRTNKSEAINLMKNASLT